MVLILRVTLSSKGRIVLWNCLDQPNLGKLVECPMAEKIITTDTYTLFPSPRNQYAQLFAYEVFVPHPYTLIDLPSFDLKGKASLFGAHRLVDGKAGQLVTFELAQDEAKFKTQFVPD